MGRPKLQDGKRTKKIDVRFTPNEYLVIERLEKELGISRTELIRKRTLDQGDVILVNAKELIASLDFLGAEMNRIGNNINQLARHANSLNLRGALEPSVVDEFNRLFSEYLGLQQQLQASLRSVIRASAR